MKAGRLVFGALAGWLVAVTAQAVPVIYDFTGVGFVSTFTGVGAAITTQDDVAFTGSMTIDVHPDGFGGTDSYVSPDGSYAYDYSGWVDSSFTIQWGSVLFSPRAGSDPNSYHYSDQFAHVTDGSSDHPSPRAPQPLSPNPARWVCWDQPWSAWRSCAARGA